MLQQEDRMRQDASVQKDVISDAVRRLRIAFGETQQRFAERLGTALITVTRWETSRPPTTDSALDQLEKLARDKGLEEYAEVFKSARTDRSRAARLRTAAVAPLALQNEQETNWCSALLRAMRNPQQYAPELQTIESALSRPLADIEEVISNAQVAGDVVKAISGWLLKGKHRRKLRSCST